MKIKFKDMQNSFDDLTAKYEDLEQTNGSVRTKYDNILSKFKADMEATTKALAELQAEPSASTTATGARKRNGSVISSSSDSSSDESEPAGRKKVKRTKKVTLLETLQDVPVITFPKTFVDDPERAEDFEGDIENIDFVKIGNKARDEINEELLANDIYEDDRQAKINLDNVVLILRYIWLDSIVKVIFLNVLSGIRGSRTQRIEMIFDRFMSTILDEYGFDSTQVAKIRDVEEEWFNTLSFRSERTKSILPARFEDYLRLRGEYIKRYDVYINNKFDEETIEVEFDPTVEW